MSDAFLCVVRGVINVNKFELRLLPKTNRHHIMHVRWTLCLTNVPVGSFLISRFRPFYSDYFIA